ncbi:uncharacterized protein VTP21DRAFT_4884 [Calcarisporiella thermophila]|uniref:uncharacterized protein n=1 Tax=Calcarisporiella thermophila TaxID=911321 RepID=UPI003741F722
MGYVETFMTDRPRDGLEPLQSRLRKAKILHEELANYFHERALIEEMYAKSLQKLAKKSFITDRGALGTFATIWDLLHKEIGEMANVHTQMGKMIMDEVERSLRAQVGNAEWAGLKMYDCATFSLVREYDDWLAKVQKHQKALDKTANSAKHEAASLKLSNSTHSLQGVRDSWSAEAPLILQKFQLVDEARLANLKEMVERFEQIQSEQLMKRISAADTITSALLEFDIPAEIERFCSSFDALPRLQQSQSMPHSPPQSLTPSTSEDHVKERSGLRNALGTFRRRRKSTSTQYTSMSDHSGGHDSSHARIGGFTAMHTNDEPEQPPSLSMPALEDATATGAEPSGETATASAGAWDGPEATEARAPSLLHTPGDIPRVTVDEEGYSIPPPSADRKPWDHASHIGSDGDGDDESDTMSLGMGGRMRVEIKPQVTSENTDDASNALTRVKSMLQASRSPTVSRRRGRRDYRNTASFIGDTSLVISPGMSITDGSGGSEKEAAGGLAPPSPFSYEAPASLGNGPAGAGPANGHGPHVGGVVVGITETVNLLTTEDGSVSRVLVTGEVNLSAAEPVQFRLDAAETALDKIVPNPAFIAEAGDGYQFTPHPAAGLQAAIKYQVHATPDHTDPYLPIEIRSIWRCEAGVTSLLVDWKLRPDWTLSELAFLVPVDGGVQKGQVQSRPQGVWNPERQKMLWRVDTAELTEGRLMARFVVEGQSKPAPIAVKWASAEGRLVSGVAAELLRGGDGESRVERRVVSGKYIVAPSDPNSGPPPPSGAPAAASPVST